MKCSIIVPVYNSEIFLEECLESLRKQTYKNLEILLIDDGSTDSSFLICCRFAEIDGRFRVIKQKNQGVAAARYSGFKQSTGAYIGFVDSDDLVSPSMFETLMYEAQNNSAEIVECSVRQINFDSKETIERKLLPKIQTSNYEIMLDFFEGTNYEDYMVNKIYSRELFSRCQKQNYKYSEDHFSNYEIVKHCSSRVVLDDVLYTYRRHEGSATLNRNFNSDKLDIILVAEKIYEEVIDLFPQFSNLALIYLLDNLKSLYIEASNDLTLDIIKKRDYCRHLYDKYRHYYPLFNEKTKKSNLQRLGMRLFYRLPSLYVWLKSKDR